jgi:hypothetical protein
LVPWDQLIFDPIKLPGRKPLVSLRDAAEYIMELLDAEHGLPHAFAMGRGRGAATGRCRMPT